MGKKKPTPLVSQKDRSQAAHRNTKEEKIRGYALADCLKSERTKNLQQRDKRVK